MSLYLGENKIADNTCSRNIGEIVASAIPLSDAGLHLLDGALISSAGSYAKFVNYIAGLVTDYPDLFTTEANWQSSVSTYGVCGKFVYDNTNNTVRLPKITGFTEGTTDVTALGDLVEAGLPNITGEFNIHGYYYGYNTIYNASGAFSEKDSGRSTNRLDTDSSITGQIVTFDASDSSSIYGNSTTVQPQSIKVLYYIVIATSVKTDIKVDIDEIATDLNGKADVDLSNMNPTQTVKNTIVGWGMPDYSAGIEIVMTSNIEETYICPSDGFVIFSGGGFNGQYSYLKVNDIVINNASTTGNSYITNVFACALVSKNDVCKFKNYYDSTVFGKFFKFFPLKGVN